MIGTVANMPNGRDDSASVDRLPVVRTTAALRQRLASWRAEGLRIALVPTMGALHVGHLSLVRQAQQHSDRVVVSLFVNPTQFAPHEDFAVYPRDEAGDRGKLLAVGGDLLFAPEVAEMYPPGAVTRVSVPGLGDDLEGVHRPGFFTGVATVVSKLLLQCLPDVAVFGEKDYQQLLVIRRLVADLDIPVTVLAGATVREDDGLALSSRNAYLDAPARVIAGRLNQVLGEAATGWRHGQSVDAVEAAATAALLAAGFDRVDYVALRDAETLGAATPERPARVLAAAHIGGTRLIDNCPA